jgi:hypothetical protein
VAPISPDSGFAASAQPVPHAVGAGRRKRKRSVFSRRKGQKFVRTAVIAAGYAVFLALLVFIWMRVAYSGQ